MEERQRRDPGASRTVRLASHAADCNECRAAPLPLEHLAVLLDASTPDLDPAALSQQTFTRLRPALRRRAQAAAWQRVGIGMLLSLLPLPLILAYNTYVLRVAYDVLKTLLPAAFAAYLVLSYAAFLVLLFATTYAAIPLLVVRNRSHLPAAHG